MATRAPATPSPAWPYTTAPGTTIGGAWVDQSGTLYTAPAGPGPENLLMALGQDGRPKPGWPIALPDTYLDLTIGSDGALYVITVTADGTAGHVVALTPGGTISAGWPYAVDGSPGLPVLGRDGTVYVDVRTKTYFSALALTPDGQLKPGWPYRVATTGNFYPSVGLGPDDTVYVAGAPGLVALDSQGQIKAGWPFVASGPDPSIPLFGPDGTLYLHAFKDGGASNVIAALGSDGKPKVGWASPTIQAGVAGMALATDGTLYAAVGSSNGSPSQVLAFGPTGAPKTGWEPYRTPSSDHFSVGVTLGPGGAIYVTNQIAGTPGTTWPLEVAALGPDGRPVAGWPSALRNVRQTPLVGQDGTVYVESENIVTALDPSGQVKDGWPFRLPADVTSVWVSLGADGLVYIVGSGATGIAVALTPAGVVVGQ